MNTIAKYSAIVALISIGIVAAFLFMSSRDSAPNAYAAVTKACQKTDEVTDYDITQYTEVLLENGELYTVRSEHQISSGNVFSKMYHNGEYYGDSLYIDDKIYNRTPGGKWQEFDTEFDLAKVFREFPYDGASLCSDIEQVSAIGDGTVESIAVKRYKTERSKTSGDATITDLDKRVGYKVFSVDSDGWLRQVDHDFGTNDLQNRKDRSVFSGIGEPNDIPDPNAP